MFRMLETQKDKSAMGKGMGKKSQEIFLVATAIFIFARLWSVAIFISFSPLTISIIRIVTEIVLCQ